jgi:hypothetical protein
MVRLSGFLPSCGLSFLSETTWYLLLEALIILPPRLAVPYKKVWEMIIYYDSNIVKTYLKGRGLPEENVIIVNNMENGDSGLASCYIDTGKPAEQRQDKDNKSTHVTVSSTASVESPEQIWKRSSSFQC